MCLLPLVSPTSIIPQVRWDMRELFLVTCASLMSQTVATVASLTFLHRHTTACAVYASMIEQLFSLNLLRHLVSFGAIHEALLLRTLEGIKKSKEEEQGCPLHEIEDAEEPLALVRRPEGSRIQLQNVEVARALAKAFVSVLDLLVSQTVAAPGGHAMSSCLALLRTFLLSGW